MNRADLAVDIAHSVFQYVDLDSPRFATQGHLLSQEERDRAERLHFELDRKRFEAAHVALRLLLEEQSMLHAGALRFAYGPHGKPWIPDLAGLQFSLSHSDGLALIAVGYRGPLGVDVEHLRALPDALILAEQHFTSLENQALRSLQSAKRARAFLTCWTRKEACLKAIGLGLGLAPCMVEVGLEPAVRRVSIPLEAHVFHVVVGPAPAWAGSVASIAEWREPQQRLKAPKGLTPPPHALRDTPHPAAANSQICEVSP